MGALLDVARATLSLLDTKMRGAVDVCAAAEVVVNGNGQVARVYAVADAELVEQGGASGLIAVCKGAVAGVITARRSSDGLDLDLKLLLLVATVFVDVGGGLCSGSASHDKQDRR